MATRCQNLRLDEALDGRSGGGEGGQPIVAGIGGRVGVGHGAHGNDVGYVARDTDGHGVGSTVTGGGDHNNAGLPCRHHGLVERVVPVVGAHFTAEGQVEHADAVGVLVGHHEVNAPDDVRIGAATIASQGLDRHQADIRRHAVVAAGGFAGQILLGWLRQDRRRGHVGSMAEAVFNIPHVALVQRIGDGVVEGGLAYVPIQAIVHLVVVGQP